jgi:RNA polymerase sigma factor (sigma-70 family)
MRGMDPRVGEPIDPTPASEQEQRWLAAFRSGDAQAFQPLVRPHLPALVALARRHCRDQHWADDLVQETLVRAYRGMTAFRGDAALRTWLFRILVRLASEPGRWQRGERAAPLEIDVPDHLDEPALTGAIERELGQQLEAAMERLPARQRTALHLRAVEGMDYAAIALVLECSAAAARMLVLEARRKVLARIGGLLEP